MERRGKRGQQTMGIPFGLIFSIILIVVFIVLAFIAVNYFLDIGKCSSVGMFYDDLQDSVDKAWSSQTYDDTFEVSLPSGIEKVCFGNFSADITDPMIDEYREILNYEVYEANTFLVPPEKSCNMQWKQINHINISRITEMRNPYCVDVSRDLRLKKDFYDKNVVIE